MASVRGVVGLGEVEREKEVERVVEGEMEREVESGVEREEEIMVL